MLGSWDAGIDERLAQDTRDGEARIECIERILKDELRSAAESPEGVARKGGQILATDGDGAGRRCLELQQQTAGRRLAAPRLAKEPDAFIRIEREVDAIHRVHDWSLARQLLAERSTHGKVLDQAVHSDEGDHVLASLASDLSACASLAR